MSKFGYHGDRNGELHSARLPDRKRQDPEVEAFLAEAFWRDYPHKTWLGFQKSISGTSTIPSRYRDRGTVDDGSGSVAVSAAGAPELQIPLCRWREFSGAHQWASQPAKFLCGAWS